MANAVDFWYAYQNTHVCSINTEMLNEEGFSFLVKKRNGQQNKCEKN